MPHITLKMLKGRTDEQKKIATEKLSKALNEAIGASESHISVSIEEYTAEEWQDVLANEIENNKNITKQPAYDPKSLLK